MSIHFKELRDPKLNFDDVLSFGMHRGYTVAEILKDRPEYIAWLIDNTSYKFTKAVEDVVNIHCPFSDDVDDRWYDEGLALIYDDIHF